MGEELVAAARAHWSPKDVTHRLNALQTRRRSLQMTTNIGNGADDRSPSSRRRLSSSRRSDGTASKGLLPTFGTSPVRHSPPHDMVSSLRARSSSYGKKTRKEVPLVSTTQPSCPGPFRN